VAARLEDRKGQRPGHTDTTGHFAVF